MDLERRIHRNQPLGNLSQMSYVILQGAIRKLEERHRLELLTEVGRGMKLINQEKDRFNLEVREIGDALRPRSARSPPTRSGGGRVEAEVTSARCAVVIAPDSFGGASTAPAVADAIAAGWARARPSDVHDLAADGRWRRGDAGGGCRGPRQTRGTAQQATVDALGRPIERRLAAARGGRSGVRGDGHRPRTGPAGR